MSERDMAGPVEQTETGAGAEEGAESFKPRRRGALLAALGVIVLGGLSGVFALTRESREPLRVLIAVDARGQWWEGSTTAARLLDNVAPHLQKLGFDPVDGGDPAILAKLEGAATPEEAAERVGASFVVGGRLAVELARLEDAGMVELRVQGALRLSHAEGGTRELGQVRTWSGAPEEAEALKLASESLGWQTFDVLLPGLMAHEAVQAIERGSDAIARGKLTAAKGYLEKRGSQLDFAKRAYGELEQRFASGDASPNKITLHTPLDRQDGLCAMGASGFFAKSSAIRPFYSPVRDALGYFLELERLYWKEANGKARTTFEGYNVLGYGSASPDGTTAAYVEDRYGTATALHVVRGAAPPERVFSQPKLLLSEPKVAPGGQLSAVWARECRRCPAFVLVVDLRRKSELYRSDPKLQNLGGFVWLSPERLGVLVRPVEAAKAERPEVDEDEDDWPSQSLTAIDLATAPPEIRVLGTVAGSATLSLPSASGGGRRVAFSRSADDGMHLALYDEHTKTLEPLPAPGGHDPSLSPQGDAIAFMRDGEIFVYDIAARTDRQLTHTGQGFSLRYPQFSLDGKAVYFEVRAKDPVFPKERSLSAIASVPAR